MESAVFRGNAHTHIVDGAVSHKEIPIGHNQGRRCRIRATHPRMSQIQIKDKQSLLALPAFQNRVDAVIRHP